MRDSSTAEILSEIFAPVGAGPGGTATTLISPSSIDGDIVRMVADQVDLDGVLRDLGTIAARALADELEQKALKPSDYAAIGDLSVVLAARIVKALSKSESFARAFTEQLLMRG